MKFSLTRFQFKLFNYYKIIVIDFKKNIHFFNVMKLIQKEITT